jgi:hypothetical protein
VRGGRALSIPYVLLPMALLVLSHFGTYSLRELDFVLLSPPNTILFRAVIFKVLTSAFFWCSRSMFIYREDYGRLVVALVLLGAPLFLTLFVFV